MWYVNLVVRHFVRVHDIKCVIAFKYSNEASNIIYRSHLYIKYNSNMVDIAIDSAINK